MRKKIDFSPKNLRKFQNVATKWPKENATTFRQRNPKQTFFFGDFAATVGPQLYISLSFFFSKKKSPNFFRKKLKTSPPHPPKKKKKNGKAPKSRQKNLAKNATSLPRKLKKLQNRAEKKNAKRTTQNPSIKVPKNREFFFLKKYLDFVKKMWKISKFSQGAPARIRANFKPAPQKIDNASKKNSKIRRRSNAKKDRLFGKKICASFKTSPPNGRRRAQQHFAKGIWNILFFDGFAATAGPRRHIQPSKI